MINPYDYLCIYDPRSTYRYAEMEDPPEPRNGCACDYCFYGKDDLALEIIRLREALEFIHDWTALLSDEQDKRINAKCLEALNP